MEKEDTVEDEKRERLTTQEAAQFLGVNVKTLRDWADKGWIAHVRAPGERSHRWFNLDALEAFAERMRRGPEGKLAA